jgi:16S rRNA (adenine1518-N6/adenine1519-N6)-dimethyltransferase
MRAKKSLGQNFLTSQSVVDKIVETANLNDTDIVLEVGPGKGILTQALLRSAGKVIAVEKDDALIYLLKEKFAQEIKDEKLVLVRGDILKFDFKEHGLKKGNYKIVANIPYYITGEFLRKTLSSDTQPLQMVILLQKEVVERMARSKKESILSISVKVYGEPKYIQTVKAGNFSPAPKIDSAILSIENISKNFFSGLSEESFFKVLKTGFAHKRKLLISNLSVQKDKEEIKKAFVKANIDEKARAEELSLEQWLSIAKII